MALWKDPSVKDSAPGETPAAEPAQRPGPIGVPTPAPESPKRPAPAGAAKESLIAADVTIEGKIEGAGHVRIAGRFKGDVNVQGNVTIEHRERRGRGQHHGLGPRRAARDRRDQRRRQGSGAHRGRRLAHARPG